MARSMAMQESLRAVATRGLVVSTAVGALLASAPTVVAGGLGVREQSASGLGEAFAGSAAGGDLSSSFWNSAAIGIAQDGLSTESHYALIAPSTSVHSDSVTVLPGSVIAAGTQQPSGDTIKMDRPVLVGASYGAWRLNQDLVLGVAINSPFGLSNETNNDKSSSQYFFRSAKLFTINANPMFAYRLAPGLQVGAGVQIQYASLSFKANPSAALAPSQASEGLDGDDTAFGYTLGALYQPAPGTSIGLGYRSAVRHDLDGAAFMTNGVLVTGAALGGSTQVFSPVSFSAKLTTPDIATLSFRQSIAPNARLLGTVEWTGWSKVDTINFQATSTGGLLGLGATGTINPGATLALFNFHWQDGWLYSIGGEYDYSKQLTLRSGIGYELSPERNSNQRFINITDSNRIWLSGGATYKWSEKLTFDLGYSHIFFQDAPINTNTVTPGSTYTPVRNFLGTASSSADIVSVSMKTRW